ncbi:MAG: hypothetical protein KI786_18190 [Mameliella sp.]|nr:hypothetical protein [Phaeodactylibacter sp.]
MSRFKEISALRKSGQLQEALAAAQTWLTNEPENIWAKRAISWVYYDYLKGHVAKGDFDQVCIQLENIGGLQLPEDEEMVFEKIAYSLGKFFFQLAKEDEAKDAYSLFKKIKGLTFPKPSEAYSFLLKAMHKAFKEAPQYREVIEWWGLENLRPSDFKKEEYNGKRIMSVAEQVLIAYSRQLLPSKADIAFGHEVDTVAIQQHIELLKDKISRYPELSLLQYFEAKLMLATHQEEDALKVILPFVRRKQRDFWTWQILAETLEDNPEGQIACYIKALQCQIEGSFLVNIRSKLAGHLIRKQQYAEARYEIEQSILARQDKGWRISGQLQNWQKEEWYKNTDTRSDNKKLYTQYETMIGDILYQDMPVQIGIVTFVNREKRMSGFMVSKSISGTFKWRQLKGKASVGQTLELRLIERQGKEGTWYQPVGIEQIDAEPPETLVEKFSGELFKRPDWEFGLVNGVFVPPPLIRKHQLSAGDQVTGKAIISYDKKRGQWGLAAFGLSIATVSEDSIDVPEPGEASGGYS